VVSFSPFGPSIWYSFRCQSERLLKAKLAEVRRRIRWTDVSVKTKVLACSPEGLKRTSATV